MAPILLGFELVAAADAVKGSYESNVDTVQSITEIVLRILIFFISVPILWLLSNFIIKIIENIRKKKAKKIEQRIFKLIFIIIVNINMKFIINFIINLFRNR